MRVRRWNLFVGLEGVIEVGRRRDLAIAQACPGQNGEIAEAFSQRFWLFQPLPERLGPMKPEDRA